MMLVLSVGSFDAKMKARFRFVRRQRCFCPKPEVGVDGAFRDEPEALTSDEAWDGLFEGAVKRWTRLSYSFACNSRKKFSNFDTFRLQLTSCLASIRARL